VGRKGANREGDVKRRRRRALTAGALLGLVVTVSISIWERPASASSAPAAWVPLARDLHHADGWVLSGERASRQIARTHARVLFVGDSITQWWQRFGAVAWQTDFAPLGAADDGVAGDTTSNLLARIDDGSLAGLHPGVVLVMIGTNNIPLRQSAADITRGVLTVVANLKSRLPGAKVILLAVLPRGRPGSAYRLEAMAVDRLLAARASAVGVAYLDLGPQLLGRGGQFLPGVMHPDLLHPAAGGYDRMAARLTPVVRRLLAGAPA
jgi:lysophospholipase L1-like esterase